MLILILQRASVSNPKGVPCFVYQVSIGPVGCIIAGALVERYVVLACVPVTAWERQRIVLIYTASQLDVDRDRLVASSISHNLSRSACRVTIAVAYGFRDFCKYLKSSQDSICTNILYHVDLAYQMVCFFRLLNTHSVKVI